MLTVVKPPPRSKHATLPDTQVPDALRALREAYEAAPVLMVLTGPQLGERVKLTGRLLIGRDPEAGLVLSDERVAWHQAGIEPVEDAWHVVDLSGVGSTAVNGVRVDAPYRLTPDDQLILGHTVVRFEVHDPVEQAYDEAVLERLNRDELTGLLSRRKFDLDLRATVAAARRTGGRAAVAILDLDGLKALNDRWGHEVGARAIAHAGQRIGGTVGPHGLVCRLGGDEFGVVLPSYGSGEAVALLDEARRRVTAEPFETEDGAVALRLSAGMSMCPDHGITPQRLLRAADRALYAAKRAGGDRTCVATSSHPPGRGE
jgi:diguanylate cyclase (GGDEF)-like protein